MIHIRRTTKNDVLESLPSIQAFTGHQIKARSPISLLICSAGFEDRATAIGNATSGSEIQGLLIIRYPTNVEENARSLETLRAISAKQTSELTYDRADFRRSFRAAIDGFITSVDSNVVVDISVLSSYLFYRVFDGIVEHRFSPCVSVFYAEAIDYYPQQSEWRRVHAKARRTKDFLKKANLYEQSGFQSLGVDAIYESESFPGQNISALPNQIVAVPNFSRARMREMLAYAESHYNASLDGTAWIIGQPPDDTKNGWRYEAMRELYEPMNTVVPVGTRDYKHIMIYLIDLWESLNIERHMVIAALGSKLQHLGIFLFLKMRPDTGLLLSEPRSFVASRFSSGVGPTWWIDFGPVSSLKELLSSYGKLDFRWE